MKGIGIFILGFAAGVLFTFFGLFLFTIGSRDNEIQHEKQIQYVEIKGKKGNVQLYTGMPKDSVLILAGKPENIKLNSIGSKTYETWQYNMTSKYISDLEIEFENGKLTGVTEY